MKSVISCVIFILEPLNTHLHFIHNIQRRNFICFYKILQMPLKMFFVDHVNIFFLLLNYLFYIVLKDNPLQGILLHIPHLVEFIIDTS